MLCQVLLQNAQSAVEGTHCAKVVYNVTVKKLCDYVKWSVTGGLRFGCAKSKRFGRDARSACIHPCHQP